MNMRLFNIILLSFVLNIGMSACSGGRGGDDNGAAGFRLPDVPDTLRTPEARAAYLSVHYWDNFDFADTSFISRVDITEQALVDFVSILPYTGEAQAAVDTLFRRASVSSDMLRHFVSLCDKYLYEPNSPMHNEELYILALRSLTSGRYLDTTETGRYRFRLDMALKNRPGSVANDFVMVCRDGRRLRLSDVKADRILIFFNDPECDDCQRAKESLSASNVISRRLADGQLVLLSVCVEGNTDAWRQSQVPPQWTDGYDEGRKITRDRTYDLKAMPTLYLLDGDRKVLIKDGSIEQIVEVFREESGERRGERE